MLTRRSTSHQCDRSMRTRSGPPGRTGRRSPTLADGAWSTRWVPDPCGSGGGSSGAPGWSGGMDRAVGQTQSELSSWSEFDDPAVVVDLVVVPAAHGQQIVEVGSPAVAPPHDVMQLASVVVHVAARDPHVSYRPRNARRCARFASRVDRPRSSTPGACSTTPLRTTTAWTSPSPASSAITRAGTSTGIDHSAAGPSTSVASASITTTNSGRPALAPTPPSASAASAWAARNRCFSTGSSRTELGCRFGEQRLGRTPQPGVETHSHDRIETPPKVPHPLVVDPRRKPRVAPLPFETTHAVVGLETCLEPPQRRAWRTRPRSAAAPPARARRRAPTTPPVAHGELCRRTGDRIDVPRRRRAVIQRGGQRRHRTQRARPITRLRRHADRRLVDRRDRRLRKRHLLTQPSSPTPRRASIHPANSRAATSADSITAASAPQSSHTPSMRRTRSTTPAESMSTSCAWGCHRVDVRDRSGRWHRVTRSGTMAA